MGGEVHRGWRRHVEDLMGGGETRGIVEFCLGDAAGEEDDRWMEELEKKMEREVEESEMMAGQRSGGGGSSGGMRTAMSR